MDQTMPIITIFYWRKMMKHQTVFMLVFDFYKEINIFKFQKYIFKHKMK